ncbi:MAG: hypothetical protein JSU61_01220 [Fidelibacterota bacterium]|nr:MAG: hypothetical protein JSU61_01220 [Candidatus Neomarinimicrobiota bacterium]
MQTIDLKALERRIWSSSFEDGLWDLFIGTMALGFAIIPLINDVIHSDFWSSFAWLPVNLAVLLFLFFGKRHITMPRVGLVRPTPQRRRKLSVLAWINVAVLSLCAVGGAVAAFGGGETLFGIYPYFMGLLVLTIFSICAYMLSVQRFYIYGLLLVLAPTVGEFLWSRRWPIVSVHHGFPVTFGVAASIIIITGVVLLIRFIQATPIPPVESPDAP